ncbi:MAG: haloacid dehalogenase-like hydrolase, partial [Deltaproteobacteria bacterium]
MNRTVKAIMALVLALPIMISCQHPMSATRGDGGQHQAKQPQARKNGQKKAKVALAGKWNPKVAEQLAQIIENNRPGPGAPAPVAVFDFDNTIVRGDIGRAFFDYMIKEGLFKFTEQVWNAFPEQFRDELRKAWELLEKIPAEKRAGSVELSRFRQLMHKAYWNLCKEPDPAKCFPWQVRFYAGYTPEQIEKIGRKVFEQELKKPLATEIIRA